MSEFESLLHLDLARLYTVALIERFVACSVDAMYEREHALELAVLVERMLERVESVIVPGDVSATRLLTDREVREIVGKAMSGEAIRRPPADPDDDEPVTLPQPGGMPFEPDTYEDDDEELAPAAEVNDDAFSPEQMEVIKGIIAGDPDVIAKHVVDFEDVIPPALFDMTRAEQIAYAITELGGKATAQEVVQYLVEQGAFKDERRAKGSVSPTLSTNTGTRFGMEKQRFGPTQYTVLPGWYEHEGSGPAAAEVVEKPEPQSAQIRKLNDESNSPSVTAQANDLRTGIGKDVFDDAEKVKDCPDSPTGAHHWLIASGTGPNAHGSCKYCTAERGDFKNSEKFSAWNKDEQYARTRQKAAS